MALDEPVGMKGPGRKPKYKVAVKTSTLGVPRKKSRSFHDYSNDDESNLEDIPIDSQVSTMLERLLAKESSLDYCPRGFVYKHTIWPLCDSSH